MKYGLSEQDLNLIQGVFKKFSEVERVVIFGSRAMGNFKKGSDVDLVLYGNIKHDSMTQMKDQLNNTIPLPYVFDLILWDEIEHQGLKTHITTYGREFYPIEE